MENRIEIWKPVAGYEGLYECSNMGRVRTVGNNKTKKTKIRKQVVTNLGYKQVQLYKDGKQKLLYVHRIVAEAFLLNTNNKSCIDHINTDRTDNRVENLRWCTRKGNMNNPITRTKLSNSKLYHTYNMKAIIQTSKDGTFIQEYKCTREAERATNIDHSSINKCCKGIYKTAGGFIWKYKEVA